jgi:Deoxynucleoside kinase
MAFTTKCGYRRLSVSSSTAFILLSGLSHTCRSMSTIPPLLLSIEGNIGAGKSTLIGELRRRHPTWNFVDEPVGIWSQLKNDEGKWSFPHLR